MCHKTRRLMYIIVEVPGFKKKENSSTCIKVQLKSAKTKCMDAGD